MSQGGKPGIGSVGLINQPTTNSGTFLPTTIRTVGNAHTLIATLTTNASTTASNVLNFASVPSSILPGMIVQDSSNLLGVATSTVTSTTGTTVTISNTVTVASGDTIVFYIRGNFVATTESANRPYSCASGFAGQVSQFSKNTQFSGSVVPVSIDRFEVRTGDDELYAGNQRAEFDSGDRHRNSSIILVPPGQEMWISYWMAIMTSPIDNIVSLNNGQNIIGQWHATAGTGSSDFNPMVGLNLSNSFVLPVGNAPPGGFGNTLVATAVTNAPTTASNVLNFASVPAAVTSTDAPADLTTPSSMPLGSVGILSVGATTVTLSGNVTVASGDTIGFYFPAGVRCTPFMYFSTANPMTSAGTEVDLLTAPQRVAAGLDNIALNTIHYFVHNFKTDPTGGTSGFYQMYFNGQTLAKYNGAVGYACDVGPYWKYGMYQAFNAGQSQGSSTVVWYGNMEVLMASQGNLLSRVANPLPAPSYTQLMNQ